jgi:hypothetical protein
VRCDTRVGRHRKVAIGLHDHAGRSAEVASGYEELLAAIAQVDRDDPSQSCVRYQQPERRRER